MSNYAMVCQRHATHYEECPSCRRFDNAIKQELSKYHTPPEQHIFVIRPKVVMWLKEVLGR